MNGLGEDKVMPWEKLYREIEKVATQRNFVIGWLSGALKGCGLSDEEIRQQIEQAEAEHIRRGPLRPLE